MKTGLSNLRIIGIGLMLFCSVLLGVGIHHLIRTGTCSSTGYSANYGPVPTCPAGTGWWFAFLFAGIFGALIGAMMASRFGLIFASIFGAIGFGALSLLLDHKAHSGTKVFGAIFGGSFAVVGVGAAIPTLSAALSALRSPRTKPASAGAATTAPASAFGAPLVSTAFGTPAKGDDPILSAYEASHATAGSAPAASSAPATTAAASALPTPLGLIQGLQAAKTAASGAAVTELSKLADLHKQGALTDEEFASAKAKLLGSM